jgi:two-component system cell cycle response regulator
MNDNPKILVVEDEEMLLKAITKKLELGGKRVISCISGKQALDYLAGNQADLPDAIWLDYYLKDMNGLGFMVQLKDNPAWAKIPVLVVSNSATEDKVSQMLALGAKKYILKAEARLDDLMGVVEELVAEKKGGAQA